MAMTIQKLNSLLSEVPASVVPTSMSDQLFTLVMASWHEFYGSAETSKIGAPTLTMQKNV
jgi:hypothetical protein